MTRRLPLLLALLVALGVIAGLSVRVDVAAANGCPLRLTQDTEGTEASPIRVADRAALETLATESTCYSSQYVFRQTADIDLSAAPWTPIADVNGFNGVYDGGGHRITGMTIESAAAPLGLFGSISGGTVRDLVISGARVTGAPLAYTSGVLVGSILGGEVLRVQVLNSTIAGVDSVGGLAGLACGSQISASRSAATVSGQTNVGGLIGVAASTCVAAGSVSVLIRALPTAVVDSAATGAVSGTTQVGGLIGYLGAATVSRSLASGAVTASAGSAGGLVGHLENGFAPTVDAPDPTVLSDVYASGAVAGSAGAGGLVGVYETGATVTRAYAVGRVTGGDTGGLVGPQLFRCGSLGISLCSTALRATAMPTSFWNTVTSGQTASFGDFASGRTTAQLQTLGTYADAGWAIARGWTAAAGTTWGICPSANGGYPFLQSQFAAATQPCAGLPSAPRDLKVIVGDGQVTITWQAPSTDGGSPISAYNATAIMQKASTKAAPSCAAASGATTCTITGLRNGRAYRISLTADNIEGTGTSATRVATPKRGLVVLSARRSGLSIVTRVRVGSAGRLTQVGTAARLSGTACRASARPQRAGVVVLRCPLSARAEQALVGGPLSIVATLRFRPTSGPVREAVRTVRFAQTDAAGSVTG